MLTYLSAILYGSKQLQVSVPVNIAMSSFVEITQYSNRQLCYFAR
jgi:hypothetical protein